MLKEHRHGVPWILVALVLLAVGVCLTPGCAVAPRDDGSFVLGFPFSGDGTTASGAGNLIGTAATLLGLPAGPAIGGVATVALAALGWGAKRSGDAKAAAAAHAAADRAWDERDRYQDRIDREYVEALHTPAPFATTQPVRPVAGVAVAPAPAVIPET